MATSSGHSQIARTRPRFQLHAIRPRPGHRQGRRRQRGLSENRMDAVSGLKVDPVSLDAPGPRQLGGGQLPLRLTAGEERIGAALAAPGMVFGRVALPSRRSLTLACGQARSTTSQALAGRRLAKCRVHDGRLLRDAGSCAAAALSSPCPVERSRGAGSAIARRKLAPSATATASRRWCSEGPPDPPILSTPDHAPGRERSVTSARAS